MHITLVRDAVPGLLDVLMVDLQSILLQRHEIAAIVVIVDPASPHLREAFPLLATILGPILDEGADSCVDETVIVPESVLEVALQEQLVIGVGQSHQQCSIPVADVPGFVGLYRQKYSG